MHDLNLIATAVFGVEAVVSRELDWLGYTDKFVENGRVYFKGDLEAICKCNLWLRCSERILINVGQFKAETFEELFQGTKALPWEDWIGEFGAFPVDGKSIDSTLFSVSDCQAIVKKAIVERLKLKYKKDWFSEDGAKYKVEVGLLKNMVTLTIDTSGLGLHKRGYRQQAGDAPIKETLACALLYISHWKPDRVLIDPMCGSGTIPIEAAMIAMNMAPGLKRSFVCENWSQFPRELWEKVRAEAQSAIKTDAKIRIYGSDIDYYTLCLAIDHAKLAGVENVIHLQKMDFRNISSRYKYGFIITNPPYGERLGDKNDADLLYKDMGKFFKTFDTWSFYIIVSSLNFEKLFNRKADKKRKLYNGTLQCNYYQFFGPKPPKTIDKNFEAEE